MSSDEVFIKLYHDIISDEISSLPTSLNRESLRKVRHAYYRSTINAGASDISFDTPEMRFAYIYQYATCFTSIVESHFAKIFDEGEYMVEEIIQQRSIINICCLGGGPGTEIVAFSKALEHFMMAHELMNQVVINAVIIDVESGWETSAEKVVRQLPDHFESSLIDINLRFITGNLADPFTEDIIEAIEESDVVTMVKLLSSMHGTSSRGQISRMLQTVARGIKRDALLFYMDSSGYSHPQEIRCMSRFGLKEIYGPVDSSSYDMSYLTKLYICISHPFQEYGSLCTMSSKNYICAWKKN